MKDRKLTKGTYYSCQHQKLDKNKCNTCKDEQERERERERERAKSFSCDYWLVW